MAETRLTYEYLQKEICKRDDAKGTGYDLRANHVSACLGHLFDILAEEHIKWLDTETDIMTSPWQFYMEEVEKRAKKIRKARSRKSKRPDKKARR